MRVNQFFWSTSTPCQEFPVIHQNSFLAHNHHYHRTSYGESRQVESKTFGFAFQIINLEAHKFFKNLLAEFVLIVL